MPERPCGGPQKVRPCVRSSSLTIEILALELQLHSLQRRRRAFRRGHLVRAGKRRFNLAGRQPCPNSKLRAAPSAFSVPSFFFRQSPSRSPRRGRTSRSGASAWMSHLPCGEMRALQPRPGSRALPSALAWALASVGRAGAPISVRIEYVILGPSTGGTLPCGAAPDQMVGEVVVGGIAHELRAQTSYYPMAVDGGRPAELRAIQLLADRPALLGLPHIGRCARCSSVRLGRKGGAS